MTAPISITLTYVVCVCVRACVGGRMRAHTHKLRAKESVIENKSKSHGPSTAAAAVFLASPPAATVKVR